MKILIVNAGSSSLKYQLVDMDGEKLMAKGLVERIGIEGSKLTQKVNGQEIVFEQPIKDHTEACSLTVSYTHLGILQDHAVGAAQALSGHVRDALAADLDAALIDVIEAHEQVDQLSLIHI